MKQKQAIKGILIASALAWSVTANLAQASVLSTLNGSAPSIQEGQSVNFLANLQDILTPGYDTEAITSVSYSFFSGDGQSYNGNLTGLSTSYLNLSHTFNYNTAGNYVPGFAASVSTYDTYHTTTWVSSGYYTSYSCGFLNLQTCTTWVDTSGYATNYYSTQLGFSTSSQTSLQVAAVPTAVPLPASVMLLGSGLVGLLGVVRKRKVA